MKITDIEDKLDALGDPMYYDIIDLLIDSVRDYPEYGMDDIDNYLLEIKNITNRQDLNINAIEQYAQTLETKDLWIKVSLNSLIKALSLMKEYNISLSDLYKKLDEAQ